MILRLKELILVALFASAIWACASPQSKDFDAGGPAGIWNLSGVDEIGTTWSATLVLAQGEGGQISGHADWVGDNGASGREYVEGTFDAQTRATHFSGTKVKHSDGVVRCEYSATVSKDGTRLEHGKWTDKDESIPGTWEAFRLSQ